MEDSSRKRVKRSYNSDEEPHGVSPDQTSAMKNASTFIHNLSEEQFRQIEQAALILGVPVHQLLQSRIQPRVQEVSTLEPNGAGTFAQNDPTFVHSPSQTNTTPATISAATDRVMDSEDEGAPSGIGWRNTSMNLGEPEYHASDQYTTPSNSWNGPSSVSGMELVAHATAATSMVENMVQPTLKDGISEHSAVLRSLGAPSDPAADDGLDPMEGDSQEADHDDSIMVVHPLTRHTDPWEYAAATQLASLHHFPNHSGDEEDAQEAEFVYWEPGKLSHALKQKRRGPISDPKLKQQTAETRKSKACVRCRMQKIRCEPNPADPKGPCLACATAVVRKTHTLACLRYKITECTLFRTGKGPGLSFTHRWPEMKLKDLNDWVTSELRYITVSSDVCPVPLRFTVRRFQPIAQDSLHRGWMDGLEKKFTKIEPYALVSMASAMKEMRDYINDNYFTCIEWLLNDFECDTLIKETYLFARKHMERAETDEEKMLLHNFFRLWFGIRRTATDEHIIGDDMLGMAPVEDPSFHLHGKVPLPPVMIQQLDIILTIGVLRPLVKQVLEDLQRIFLTNRPRSWMTLYLVTFMMLHSCALISGENYRNARKHGLRRRFSIPQFISEHHHSGNVFLLHYHYVTKPCNPFKLDWKRRQTTRFADYSPDEIRFIMRSKELIEQKDMADRIRYNRELDLYEDEFFFVAQMFEDDWSPRDTIIDFDGGTINNVPLRIYYGDPEPGEVVPNNSMAAPVIAVR